MGQEFRYPCTIEIGKLLWFIGVIVAVVLTFQHFELPYGNIISSLPSAQKDQRAGNSSLLPHGASSTHEMLSNVTQSNGLNYTAGGQETGDNHGTETPANVNNGVVSEGSGGMNESSLVDSRGEESSLDEFVDTNTNSTFYVNNDVGSEGIKGLNKSLGIDNHGRESSPEQLLDQNENSTLELNRSGNGSASIETDRSLSRENITSTSENIGTSQAGITPIAPALPPVDSPSNIAIPRNAEPRTLAPVVPVESNTSKMDKDASHGLENDGKAGEQLNNSTSLQNNTSVTSVHEVKKESHTPSPAVISISEMNNLQLQSWSSPISRRPRWPSAVDQELLNAKSQIQKAPLVESDSMLYAPLYRNISMFKKSYELMEDILKVYIYKEGERPILHQPPLKGIYASEGWFMKLLEANKKFVTKDPKKSHLFYLPFSSRNLEAPSETRQHMANCIRALCNSDAKGGFVFGKDAALPETTVRTPQNLLRDLGGKPASKRSILAFFAGSMHGYLRPILLQHWGNKDPDIKVFGKLPKVKGRGKMNYPQYMKSSKYCICAKGFEVNSPRVVESIFYECVPVIISDNFVPPFFEVLNWESFAVFVLEKDIPNLKNILLSIPENKYREMQMRVKKVQQHFLWHARPVKYDIFHMILHSVWYNRVFQVHPR
ncbi:probable glycosyltransferase At3g07620 isoform X2 [Populus alba]|uniref:probable glycosyltransferase At3g07620 isoform X2 n=1 Tax=Populus alba TaxID=43335 RepID=UPI00158EF3E4|nr:probable glycosyltransferase At5g03795 isoform X2 [Populus alba]